MKQASSFRRRSEKNGDAFEKEQSRSSAPLPHLLTSQSLSQSRPTLAQKDLDVEFYPRNVVALKTSDTEFPSVVDAQGTGHIIIQPNHPLQRYHDTSELIFETGTRPLTASKSPYTVARSFVAAPPYPMSCGRRSCHDHYFEKIKQQSLLDKQQDVHVFERPKRECTTYADYNSPHGIMDSSKKFAGYRTINPNPNRKAEKHSGETPLFIHTTRSAALTTGIPYNKPFS
eukprot:TRINITY_DN1291_c0_g1_i11.p1 TRINITY_DN1291_c0_g1~~TRINITY_DN1291_c0_g1_i11.p1  ORF type:complete len:229 (-),score=34.87 TRINITY_DN1291_c0_g1_i11:226-912(-)